MELLQNIPAEKQYTIEQFANHKGVTPEAVRLMIWRNKIPENFEVIKISERKRIIVEKSALQKDEPKYIHPSEMPADVIVNINNCLSATLFIKPSGKPNIKKIAEHVQQHYWTVKRFIEGSYKAKDEARADKGVSRKFKRYKTQSLKQIRRCFEKHFQSSAQINVQQAIRAVKKELGEEIPVRLAAEWKHALLGTHTMKHYYRTFIKKNCPHIRRDLWGETANFMDVVECDVWPVDVPFIDDETRKQIDEELQALKHSNYEQWEKQRTKAYRAEMLAFIDRKTRYPLQILICPHSVSAVDVKKGLMLLIKQWGMFKQLYIDNGREFFNETIIDFLYGLFNEEKSWTPRATNQKVIELKQEERIGTSKAYAPYGKGLVERFFRENKDRWASYQTAYSPNRFESRKPTLRLSAVQPTLNFNELAQSLMEFIYNDYLKEERPEMFLNPGRTKEAECNIGRPVTIEEAFDRAYGSPEYIKTEVSNELLAFHYAQKFKVTFREGTIRLTYKTFVLRYVPDDEYIENFIAYTEKKKALTLILNPANIYECWIYDGNKKIGRATDIRFSNDKGTGIDRANYINKKQNAVIAVTRKRMRLIDEYESLVREERITNKFTEADFNPEIKIEESFEEMAEIGTNNEEGDSSRQEDGGQALRSELNIWDLEID